MDRKIDHLISTVRIAQGLLPRSEEGKDISSRLDRAMEEILRHKAKQDYIRSHAERGIPLEIKG